VLSAWSTFYCLLAIGVILGLFLFSIHRFRTLQNQNRALLAQYRALEETNLKNLKDIQSLDHLKLNYDSLRIQNTTTTRHCDELLATNQQLQNQLQTANTECDRLTRLNDNLTEEQDQLRRRNNETQIAINELQSDNVALTTARDNLETTLNRLQTDNMAIRNQHYELGARNAALATETNRLRALNNRYVQNENTARQRLANLSANFPHEAEMLLGTPEEIPDLALNLDGSPDRRTRDGRRFGASQGHTSYVLHNGRRVCIKVQTQSEA
jgi:chromosome segregation ATPase